MEVLVYIVACYFNASMNLLDISLSSMYVFSAAADTWKVDCICFHVFIMDVTLLSVNGLVTNQFAS